MISLSDGLTMCLGENFLVITAAPFGYFGFKADLTRALSYEGNIAQSNFYKPSGNSSRVFEFLY
jgi:hypothetical protein